MRMLCVAPSLRPNFLNLCQTIWKAFHMSDSVTRWTEGDQIFDGSGRLTCHSERIDMVHLNNEPPAYFEPKVTGLARIVIEFPSGLCDCGVARSGKNLSIYLVPFSGLGAVELEELGPPEGHPFPREIKFGSLPSRPYPQVRPRVGIRGPGVCPPSDVRQCALRKRIIDDLLNLTKGEADSVASLPLEVISEWSVLAHVACVDNS